SNDGSGQTVEAGTVRSSALEHGRFCFAPFPFTTARRRKTMHTRSLMTATAIVTASLLALSGCASGNDAAPADVTAAPEYSGTLSILTKFAGPPLEPYFEDLAAAYTELHPDVKFDLIQESDQSVKDKVKTLTASGALPDIYFTYPGNWAEN